MRRVRWSALCYPVRLTVRSLCCQVFAGDFFGPAGMSLPIVATGRQASVAGGVGLLRTSACSVLGAGHTSVACTTPAGVGAGYSWTISVAGQESAPSTQTTSYGLPSVTAVAVTGSGVAGGDEAGSVPTAGGATVTLSGVNFGADASNILVLWNGTVLPRVAVTVPHTALSFTSQPGQGAGVEVTLMVAGQPAETALRIPFAAPRVTLLRLDKSAGNGASMDCSVINDDGRPGTDFGPQQRAVLVIMGVNFGRGDATVATIHDVPCTLRGPVTDSRIVCETPFCTGTRNTRFLAGVSCPFCTLADCIVGRSFL